MSKNQKEYTWMPSLKWMLKTLIIIYIVIIVAYFSLNN
jgi:Na+/H+ antiporter NhaC